MTDDVWVGRCDCEAVLIELFEGANGELEVERAEHCHRAVGFVRRTAILRHHCITHQHPNAKSPSMSSQS